MIPFKPLEKVTDYQSMLRRIVVFTILAGCLSVWLLRTYSPSVDGLLGKLDFDVELPYLKKVNVLGYLLPAIAFGIFAYSIRLHDKISDLLRIRHTFDTRIILRRFCDELGVKDHKRVYANRHRAMKLAFYKYASSTDPKIDKHNIFEALDNWAWFWVLVEFWFVIAVTGIALIFLNSLSIGLIVFALATGIFLLLAPLYLFQCKKYAVVQIDDILDLPSARDEITKGLNAL